MRTDPARVHASIKNPRQGRPRHRTPELGAYILTRAHTALLNRRDGHPVLWTLPIALFVALLGPR